MPVLVFGEECSLPGNLVHQHLRDPKLPSELGEYAVWIKSAMFEVYDTVQTNAGMAVQQQKRLYNVRAVAREFPLNSWVYRHNPAKKKHKLDRPCRGVV